MTFLETFLISLNYPEPDHKITLDHTSLMAVITLRSEGYETIISVITLTVMLSIFLHGVSAVPLSKIFKKSEA